MGFSYSTVMELDFERQDMDDKIFFDRYGFEWFLLTKLLFKNKNGEIYLDWDCLTREITFCEIDNEGNYLNKRKVNSKKDLDQIISFFEPKKEEIENYYGIA